MPNVSQVVGRALREVVNDDDRVAAGDKRLRQVRSDEASAARNQTYGHIDSDSQNA